MVYFPYFLLDNAFQVQFDELEWFFDMALLHEIEPDCFQAASKWHYLHVLALISWEGTVLDHGLYESSYYENSGPVTTMDDDVALPAVLSELLCEVINEVTLLDGRTG